MCVVHTVTDLFLVCRLWKDIWWSVGLEDLTMWVDKLRALHDSESLSVVWQVVISLHRVGDLMILSKFIWVVVRLPTVWESCIVVCLLLLLVLFNVHVYCCEVVYLRWLSVYCSSEDSEVDDTLVCVIVLNRSHSKDNSLGMRPAITLMFSAVVCQLVQLACPQSTLLSVCCIVAFLHYSGVTTDLRYCTHLSSSAVVWGNSNCRAGEVGIAS